MSGGSRSRRTSAAFLSLDLPGSKMVVGDGPMLDELRRRHPDVLFAGARQGAELAAHFAAASVFVFPSRTDTFGLVMLEALASGLPVAAYPVPGPLDVLTGDPRVGRMDQNLGLAALAALALSRDELPRLRARSFSWEACARQFLLEPRAVRRRHLGRAKTSGAGGRVMAATGTARSLTLDPVSSTMRLS